MVVGGYCQIISQNIITQVRAAIGIYHDSSHSSNRKGRRRRRRRKEGNLQVIGVRGGSLHEVV